MTLVSFVKRHRYIVIDVAVLLVVVAVCVPLLVVVPDARPYCATLLAWAFVFALHLWRWLPWEKAHVRRSAHRRADAVMHERGLEEMHRQAKLLQATTTSWSLTTMAHREEGNRLPSRGGEGGEDSGDWAWTGSKQRKFLCDSNEDSSSSPFLHYVSRQSKGREEGVLGEAEDSFVVTAPAPMLHRDESPLPRISASALESSSQFLALSTSASPIRSSQPAVPEVEENACRSHEPFTHVSRRCPSSVEDTSAMSTPSLSTINPDEVIAASTAAVPLPSLSPASSCQTHGYMPPSLAGSPSPSPLHDDEESYGDELIANASRTSSSAPSPSRISVLSSTVRRSDGFALVARGASLNG